MSQEMMEFWNGICTLLQRENYTNTSSPNFYRPDYSSCPTNSVKALKATAKYARIAINKTVKVLV